MYDMSTRRVLFKAILSPSAALTLPARSRGRTCGPRRAIFERLCREGEQTVGGPDGSGEGLATVRLPDPSHLFNSSPEGNTRRAINIHEGEKVDAGAFKALVKAAEVKNGLSAKKR